jgi:hypothetical protein
LDFSLISINGLNNRIRLFTCKRKLNGWSWGPGAMIGHSREAMLSFKLSD